VWETPHFFFLRFDALHRVPPSATLCALTRAEFEALLDERFGEAATLKQSVAEPRDENVRLKGLKGRPNIKPSGMAQGTTPLKPAEASWPWQGHAAVHNPSRGDPGRDPAGIDFRRP
jgi:hypothetical protein